MNTHKRMGATDAREFRKAIREIAESSAASDCNQAERCHSHAGTGIQGVEKKNQPHDRCGRNSE
jgi:hypothetical protein